MAFSDKSSSGSSMASLDKSKALPAQRLSAISSELPVLSTALPGTGFENPPPLAISSNLLQVLKSLDLKSVGLRLDCVPFHSRWELVEWVPTLVELGENYVEILSICEEIEEEEQLEVFGPQIELNLETLLILANHWLRMPEWHLPWWSRWRRNPL